MVKGGSKVAFLSWKGVLAHERIVVRRMAACVAAVASVACIFTQWGFVGFQFADGGSAYLLFMLIPVVAATVLLGTLPGAGMGLFAGLVLYLHALFMPLDYYELTYVTPFASIAMTGLCALVLGSLLSVVLKKATRGPRRILLITLACLVASTVLTAGFTVGAIGVSFARLELQAGLNLDAAQLLQLQDQAVSAALKAGNIVFQIIGDTMIMLGAALIALTAARQALLRAGETGLRGMFAARLAVVVFTVFAVVVAFAYGVVTASGLASCQEDMKSEVDYLLRQVTRTVGYNQKVSDTLRELDASEQGAGQQDEGMALESMIASLTDGYTEDVDGLVVIIANDHVVATDVDRLPVSDQTVISDHLGEDVLAAAQTSAASGTLERIVYLAPSDYNDLVDLKLLGNREAFASLLTQQVGYLMAGEVDGYRAIEIRPSSMVFQSRDDVIMWIALSTFLLLAATSALVWQLLNQLVAQRVDATNEALERITDGDLEARVQPEGAREFWDLAAGINVTVDALQGWIAEAERRMDAELATAKAIQESALPSIFPPYPDIQRFDIYANMNAAKEVGGDFYDFFLLGDDCGPNAGRLAFVLADVSGKGVPAALFMMRAKTQLRDYLESGMELGEAVENANRQLCDGNDAGMFATAWVGILDYATRHIEFVNAGHNPPLLWQDGSWQWLRQKSGLPLGLFEGLPYRTFSIDCKVGDELLVYTDGVTEAFSVDEEQYGEERLEALVNQSFDLHPRELINSVRASVAEHAKGAEQSDDITMLAIEIGVPPEEKAQIVVPADVEAFGQVCDFIHAELDRRLCPVRVQHQLDAVLEELFVSACNHVREGVDAGAERFVRVTHSFSANPSSLTVEVIDDGAPLGPHASQGDMVEDGLGITAAKKNVDEMSYERVGDSNVVTIVKRW